MGRPTKLTKTLRDKAWEYLAECELDRLKLPTIEGLALSLEIHRDTLYDWEQSDKGFSDILESLRQAQSNKLIQKGLANQYNSTIAKLILSGKHGYVERQAVENSGEQKVTVEITKYAKPDQPPAPLQAS